MTGRGKYSRVVHYLPVYGCFATGIIYVSIGVIAILSFLKIRDGGADENSLLALLSNYVAGKILVAIILAGTICYIIWRFFEAAMDPYDYGKDFSGRAKMTGIALSTVADLLIVFSAFRFLAEEGSTQTNAQLTELRQSVAGILAESWGPLLIKLIGSVALLTALVQLYYGLTRGYRERLETEEFSPALKKTIHFFAISGYLARGLIIGITGFFYLKAGIIENAFLVVDTDKAFDFIGDNIGQLPFIITAAGTIFYGLFMFALGVGYDIDRD